ncbi:hypothetical protein D3C84_959780 [compost metagenome]
MSPERKITFCTFPSTIVCRIRRRELGKHGHESSFSLCLSLSKVSTPFGRKTLEDTMNFGTLPRVCCMCVSHAHTRSNWLGSLGSREGRPSK